MKRKFVVLLSIIWVLSLLLCSCGDNNVQSESNSLSVTENSSEQPTEYGTEISSGMKKVNKPVCLLSGDWVASMVQVDDHRSIMLIENDANLLKKAERKIVLYDFAAEKAIAEQTVESYSLSLHEYSNGVYVTGYTDSPYSTEQIPLSFPVLITYDFELNIQQEYDFTALGDRVSVENAKLSYDGSKIAYLKNDSMYIYDSDKPVSNATRLFTLGSGKGMTDISDFDFTQNGKSIACKGKCNNGSKITNGFGHWDIDGSGNGFGCDNYSEQLIMGGNKMLMIDQAAPYGSTSSGMANIRDFEKGNSTYITFEKKNESSAAILSNEGNYIVSYLDGKAIDGKGMIRISIYSSDTLQKICSYDYTGTSDALSVTTIYANDKYNRVFAFITDGTEQTCIEMIMNKDATNEANS